MVIVNLFFFFFFLKDARSYCHLIIPEYFLTRPSFCQPFERLPWRHRKRDGEGLLTLSRIWQCCRLWEDEGHCSRAVSSQHCMTAHNPSNGSRQKKKTKQRNKTNTWLKEVKLRARQPFSCSPVISRQDRGLRITWGGSWRLGHPENDTVKPWQPQGGGEEQEGFYLLILLRCMRKMSVQFRNP